MWLKVFSPKLLLTNLIWSFSDQKPFANFHGIDFGTKPLCERLKFWNQLKRKNENLRTVKIDLKNDCTGKEHEIDKM